MKRLVLLENQGKKRVRSLVTYIPHCFTLMNALCGFFAMIYAIEGRLIVAAYYIILAALIDGFDGRVARALRCTSDFGCELDSLADALSFCGAPMVLMYQWIPTDLTRVETLLLGLYVCAGLWRLAKFNTCGKDSTTFVGLPTTVAALTIALLIIYEPWIVLHAVQFIHHSVIVSIAAVLAGLMISSISFVKLNRTYFPLISRRGLLLLIAAVCALYGQYRGVPVLLFFVVSYLAISVLFEIFKSTRRI